MFSWCPEIKTSGTLTLSKTSGLVYWGYSSNPFENVLSLQETIIALSICSVTNPIIGKAIDSLKKLEGCEAHATYIIQDGELNSIKKLKINLTCEPEFLSDNLYQ